MSHAGDRAGMGNSGDPLFLIPSIHLPTPDDAIHFFPGNHLSSTLSSQSGDGVDFATGSRYRLGQSEHHIALATEMGI